jgi:hypothetical protein
MAWLLLIRLGLISLNIAISFCITINTSRVVVPRVVLSGCAHLCKQENNILMFIHLCRFLFVVSNADQESVRGDAGCLTALNASVWQRVVACQL